MDIKDLLDNLDGYGILNIEPEDAVDTFSEFLADGDGQLVIENFEELDSLLENLDGSGIIYTDMELVQAYVDEYVNFPFTIGVNVSAGLW
jgi:hypothetical protein